MYVPDQCDAKPGEFFGPIVYLNCFLAKDQAIGLYEETIDTARNDQQQDQ